MGAPICKEGECIPLSVVEPEFFLPGQICILQAKAILYEDSELNHEYLPIQGNTPFVDLARELILGGSTASLSTSRRNVASVQTISGTGANHVGAKFLAEQLQPQHVFISDPTWNNHELVWKVAAPNVVQKAYPYWHAPTRSLDFEGMVETLQSEAVENDVVILHACAHNPTGVDPTQDQWRQLAQLFKRKKLYPFFDCAYQGFASGDLDADAWATRHFQQTLLLETTDSSEVGPGMCIAQSFAKNFGLYGERVGAFHLLLPSSVPAAGCYSQLVRLSRAEISNPPLYGSRIVHTILSSPDLRTEWEQDLNTMSGRIRGVRSELRKGIETRAPAGSDWSHLESQIGMFSYTGLTKKQVKRLKEKHHVYLMENGRASLAGVNEHNVEYVAAAIDEVIRNV